MYGEREHATGIRQSRNWHVEHIKPSTGRAQETSAPGRTPASGLCRLLLLARENGRARAHHIHTYVRTVARAHTYTCAQGDGAGHECASFNFPVTITATEERSQKASNSTPPVNGEREGKQWKTAVPALRLNPWSLPCRRCLFVTGDSSVLSGLRAACTVPCKRSIRWRRRGSSVGVFRLGVLRYNHMTVGKKKKREKKQPL